MSTTQLLVQKRTKFLKKGHKMAQNTSSSFWYLTFVFLNFSCKGSLRILTPIDSF